MKLPKYETPLFLVAQTKQRDNMKHTRQGWWVILGQLVGLWLDEAGVEWADVYNGHHLITVRYRKLFLPNETPK
jgi:hypothetical protein